MSLAYFILQLKYPTSLFAVRDFLIIRFIDSPLSRRSSKYHGMHAKYRALLSALWEEFFTFYGTSNYVWHYGIFFRQIRGKVHLLPILTRNYWYRYVNLAAHLPFVSLFESKPWESEVRPNCLPLHEVDHAIYRQKKFNEVRKTKEFYDYFWARYRSTQGESSSQSISARIPHGSFRYYGVCARILHPWAIGCPNRSWLGVDSVGVWQMEMSSTWDSLCFDLLFKNISSVCLFITW